MSVHSFSALLVCAVAMITPIAVEANPYNDKLLKLPPETQAQFIKAVMGRAGETCGNVTRIFFQGLEKDTAIWSFECDGKANWMLGMEPNSNSYVATCEKMEKQKAPCWRKISQ